MEALVKLLPPLVRKQKLLLPLTLIDQPAQHHAVSRAVRTEVSLYFLLK
jgi:hypothetical protein